MQGSRRRTPQRQPPGTGRVHRATDIPQEGPDGGCAGEPRPGREGARPKSTTNHFHHETQKERRVGSGRVGPHQGRVAADGAQRRWRNEQAQKDLRTGDQSHGGASRMAQSGQTPRFTLHYPASPNHKPCQVRRIGLAFLEALLQKDPSEVAITLASSTGLKEVLSQISMSPRFLQVLCQVLRKACSSQTDRQSIQQLMGTVKESNFLTLCLPQYVAGMLTEASPAVRHQYPEHIDNIVVLVQELASIFPASSIQRVSMLMSALPASVNALRASGVDFTAEMESRLEKVQAFIQHLQEKRREGTLKVDSCTRMQPLGPEEAAGYRTMPIYPTSHEFHCDEKTVLRPNIISQQYESPAVYLDTQFRLLREDFVRPLREGIAQLVQSFDDKCFRRKKFDDIRVYFDAKILFPLCSATGIDYKVKFDIKPLRFVRWENSKRLLYGSLVCLSKDNFETFLFAAVSHRDSRDLQRGFVQLCFNKYSRALLAEVQPADSFLMVETTAYFEAYRHVLKGLQELQDEDVPFQDYIVKCEPDVRVPAYLEGGGIYDLRPLMKTPGADRENQCPEALAGGRINVLDPEQWPSLDTLSLDASQMQAVQLALTKELAIIQGPPGTGKTYVGLKIVETLLANEALREKSPILVVCYTNHALDQFLEGICKFLKRGIVRVGGRSSSEALKKFTLRELRSRCRHERRPHLRWAYNTIVSQMRESEENLKHCSDLLECSFQGILHERHLRSYISEPHWDSLMRSSVRAWLQPRASLVVEWLGLGFTPFSFSDEEPSGEENTGTQEEEEEEKTEQEEGPDLLQIAEEADLIQEERLLDCDEAGHPRSAKKAPPRTAVAQMTELFLAMKFEEEKPHPGAPNTPGDAGWEIQKDQKKRRKKKLKEELHKLQGMTEAQAEAIHDVWRLNPGARCQLYRHWLQKYQAEIRSEILQHEQTYQEAAERLAELRLQEDICILEKAQIVGMTTTGAARFRQGLQKVAPRVVIVEEAAEVLEAHTITTLSKACQHLILIGDHQQLRPSANVYDLAKNFNLEVSLFERLVKVGLPFVRLGFQVGSSCGHLVQWALGGWGGMSLQYPRGVSMPPFLGCGPTPFPSTCSVWLSLCPPCSVGRLSLSAQRGVASACPLQKPHLEATTMPALWGLCLLFQHRMRPEIAHLLTPHIYQELENHPSVLQYDNIKGVSSNLFFVEHNFPEQEIQEGKSHQNPHEAQFVVELCKYFLCQDYLPSQITILTTYTGQLFCLRRLMPAKTFQGVKVHVVDKYQGEENDIILLSLVRSNPEGRVGFLQIPNRICVALSRAKKGLFCIGNMAMLSKVPLWSKIIHTLREKGHIGSSLLLCCQNHPDTRTAVAHAADFSRVPEGGCSRPCSYRLGCGHVCPRVCHPYDLPHKEVQCVKPCQKVLCADGHRCPKLCFESCGKCLVKVPKVLPRCGHLQEVPCSTPGEEFCCQEPCGKDLRCGHSCTRTCGEECTRNCRELVLVTLRCGHSQEVPCYSATDVKHGRPVLCQTKCPSVLECGHSCPGRCHSCSAGRFHQQCSSPCQRLLICSHKCQQPCTNECPPCRRPCENRCVHSCCPKKCGELCAPCMEPCEWRCQHYQCTKLCSEPCDRPRCDEPCPKQLPCGHPCAGMCGERCPTKCLVCHHEELTQIFFGFEDEPGARFVELEDCGHIFEANGLDHYMDDAGSTAVRLKVCPSCQTPIRKSLRYGTLVRRSLCAIEEVKEKIRGSPAEVAAGSRRLKAELMGKALALERHLPEQYQELLWKLEQPTLCSRSLQVMENQVSFLVRLADLHDSTRQLDPPSERPSVRMRLAEVGEWLERPRVTFTPQELVDLQGEFQRLGLLLGFLAMCRAAKGKMDTPTAELAGTIRRVLEGEGRFTLEDERLVREKMEALKAALPKSGLVLSAAERVQIVQAIGLSQGHWFKCQNGHVYVIGECGGAMETSRCPECDEVIGGTNHRLDPSNQLAPEMDGAAHPAWSEGANALFPPGGERWFR